MEQQLKEDTHTKYSSLHTDEIDLSSNDNIYKSQELELEAPCAKIARVCTKGKRKVIVNLINQNN